MTDDIYWIIYCLYLKDLTSHSIVLAVAAGLRAVLPRYIVDVGLPSTVPGVVLPPLYRGICPRVKLLDDPEVAIM